MRESPVEWARAVSPPKMLSDGMELLGGEMKSVLFDGVQHQLDEIVVSPVDESGGAREAGERSDGLKDWHCWCALGFIAIVRLF